MKREMLRFLQKRKFRLVTRWKAALKKNIGFQLPNPVRFPYTLIFRAFDDVLRLAKVEDLETRNDHQETFLDVIEDAESAPTADQYMELFLTGRDVLGEFTEKDEAFCARFSERDRNQLRAALEAIFKHLVDREMHAYARRFTLTFQK